METRSLLNSLIFILVALYTYTAVSKLIEWSSFKDVLSRMPMIGTYSKLLVVIIPTLELLLVIALVFSSDLKYALWGSLTLLSFFTIYIFGLLNFAPHLPCSCGGVIAKLNWQQHLALNALLIAINLIALKLSRKRRLN